MHGCLMHRFFASSRRSLSFAAGIGIGLAVTWWTTIQAAALLPTLSLIGISDGATVSGVVSLGAQADAAGLASLQFQVSGANVGPEITTGACAVSWDTRTLSNGIRTVSAVGKDSAGNVVDATPILVNVQNAPAADTTAPTVTITSPAAAASVAGTITLSATANDDVGVTSVWFTVDGSTIGAEDTTAPYQVSWNSTTVPNGTHTIRAMARDAAGNTGSSSTVTITVNNAVADTTAPTVAITAPTAGAKVSGTVTITASATDNVGVTSVQLTLDGANLGSPDTTSPYSISWSTTGTSNGSHTLRAVARDAAGNTGSSATVTITVNNVSADTTAPTVTISSPDNGATVSGGITVRATASDNVGVTSVQFTVDGASLGSPDTRSPYSTTWSTTGASNGSHTLRAIARDAAGNSTTSTVTVTVKNITADAIAPTVTLTKPTGGATVSGDVLLEASASDNTSVVGVQFQVNGANVGTEVTTTPYRQTWPVKGLTSGSYALTAIARDAAGNRRTSSSVTVKVKARATPGDLDGDGVPDLVWEDASGRLQYWKMNNGLVTAESSLTPGAVDPTWRIVSIDDFDGDSVNDLLWQNSVSGQLYIWLMNHTALSNGLQPPAGLTGWRVATTADLDGDGDADIVWQQPQTGDLRVWFMNGATLRSSQPISPGRVNPSWTIVGAADFDRDGQTDLIWQDFTSGTLVVWFMNGASLVRSTYVTPATVQPIWHVKAVADFDHDGDVDIVWQSITGQVYVWYMNGTTMVRGAYVTSNQIDTIWQIVGGR